MKRFAQEIDAELSRINEDYAPHRIGDLAMLMPEVRVVKRGGFDEWMKARGKYGGQNKVPRMDNSGEDDARHGDVVRGTRLRRLATLAFDGPRRHSGHSNRHSTAESQHQ